MIKFDCFIFDVDATLVDTETVIDNIWKTWAKGGWYRFFFSATAYSWSKN
jgi:sugar-phosphatase